MHSATVVLVHGAWHGAWCWDHVVAGLTAAGVPAVALDLPGHGQSADPLTDLHGDSAAVSAALDGIDGPVVLVGHSYGGAVVTEAGVHDRVRHVVYLAAFNIDAGEAVAWAGRDEPDVAGIDHAGRPELAATFEWRDDGSTTLDPEAAGPVFYADCPPDLTEWALARLGAQGMANFTQEPTVVAWRHRPSTYVVCRDDLAVHPDLQRILARRATSCVEWDTSHSPFLSRPDLLVDLLGGLALEVGAEPPAEPPA